MAGSIKQFRWWVIALKAIIFLAALGYVYLEVFHDKDTNLARSASDLFRSHQSELWLLILALALMPLNWGLEALKWRYLIARVQKVSVSTAVQATFTGSTVSLIMPNRIGGFLARIMFLKPENRFSASYASVFGNLCQLGVTVWLGTIAFWILGPDGFPNDGLHDLALWCGMGVTLGSFLLLAMLFKPAWMRVVSARLPWLKRYAERARILEEYSRGEIAYALLLSALRYLVFGIQFALILIWVGVQLEPLHLACLIAFAWLVVALIPSFVLGNLGIRESVVLTLFAVSAPSTELVLLASLTIWVINLVLPALIGGVIMWRTPFSWPSRKAPAT